MPFDDDWDEYRRDDYIVGIGWLVLLLAAAVAAICVLEVWL